MKIWKRICGRVGEILSDLGDWDFKMFFLFVFCFSFAGLMISGIVAASVAVDRMLTD